MLKNLTLLIIIIIGVFTGNYLFDAYKTHEIEKWLQAQFVQDKDLSDIRRQQQVEIRNIKRKEELYRNTSCALNEETNSCICIHEETGRPIALPHSECIKKAKEITR